MIGHCIPPERPPGTKPLPKSDDAESPAGLVEVTVRLDHLDVHCLVRHRDGQNADPLTIADAITEAAQRAIAAVTVTEPQP